MIGAYDIAGVNKWALAQRLKTDKFFMVEHDGQTWYIDNYCARAVPTPDAFVRAEPGFGGLVRNTLAYASREDEILLHDSIDQICEQIEKVVRNESEDGDCYYARLRDGRWVHFGSMNEILRRFIFDNRHCKRTAVNLVGQTEYYRQ